MTLNLGEKVKIEVRIMLLSLHYNYKFGMVLQGH